LIAQPLLEIKDVMVVTKPMSINIQLKTVLKLGITIHTLDNKELVHLIQMMLPSKITTTKLFHKIANLSSKLL